MIQEGRLGSGSYGTVYKARGEDGVWAVKRLYKDANSEHPGIISLREIDTGTRIQHEYVSRVKKVLFESPFPVSSPIDGERNSNMVDDGVWLVMDVATFSLHELLHHKDRQGRTYSLPISHVKRMMYQCALGLLWMHELHTCHRDIKPGNILCWYKSGVATARLNDFGMSVPVRKEEHNSRHVVTPGYKAPEILLRNPHYDEKIDIWALGCTFYEMITGKVLFRSERDSGSQLDVIFSMFGSPSTRTLRRISGDREALVTKKYPRRGVGEVLGAKPRDFDKDVVGGVSNPGSWEDFIHLFAQMMQYDPAERCDAKGVLAHPFFSGVSEKDPLQYGINTAKPVYEHPSTPPTPPLWRKEGVKVFSFYLRNLGRDYHRGVFLGLDIYQRLCDNEDRVSPHSHDHAAMVCVYIAMKYLYEEGSPVLDMDGVEDYRKLEIHIISALGFILYRRTLWDYICDNTREGEADSLLVLKFLTSEPFVTSTRLDTLASIFARTKTELHGNQRL